MAIKVGGTEVVSNARELKNIATIDSTTVSTLNTALNVDPTKGTLTKTFSQNETAEITLSSNVTVGPVVSATKEVPQTGISTKGAWDVNSTASNYDFHSTAANVTLTPSTVQVANVSLATYANKNSGSLGFTGLRGVWFKPDGTKMFVLDRVNAQIVSYNLSTAWDVSTKSSDSYYQFTVYISTGAQPYNFWFNSSGTRLYVNNLGGVGEFTLSTAWDVTSISYVTGSNIGTSPYNNGTRGVFFRDDGLRMYICGTQNDQVVEYHFSSAFPNLSTHSGAAVRTFSTGVNSARDVYFEDTGTTFYITDDNGTIYEYSLTTAWDVSTASYTNNSFNAATQSIATQSIFIGGGNLYVANDNDNKVYQYNFSSAGLLLGSGSFASTDVGKRIVGNGGDVVLTSTGGAFSTTGGSAFTDSSTIAAGSWSMFGLKSAGDADGITMSGLTNLYSLNTGSNDATQTLVNTFDYRDLFISPNGQYMFAINTSNYLKRWTLSTLYDITTAGTDDQSYNVGSMSGIGGPSQAITFSTNGQQFFALDNSGNLCRTYFSTAWDITTGSNQTAGSMSTNYGDNYGLAVSSDGLTFFASSGNGFIHSKSVSSAYNPNSSQTLSRSFRKGTEGDGVNTSRIEGLTLSSDGKKAFIVMGAGGTPQMLRYDMTTAYDLATMSYANELLDISTQTEYPTGVALVGSTEGQKIAMLSRSVGGSTHAKVFQYNIGSIIQPTSQYHVGVTNTSGRIDSSAFTDINGMTAAQSAGTGTVNYAVSTDGRTTWSVNKGTSGVRPIVRNNSGTWQYNNDAGTSTTSYYNLSLGVYDNKSFVTSNQAGSPREVQFNTNGTKMYVLSDQVDKIYEYDLSTAFDVSSASYNSAQFSIGGQLGGAQGFCFNNNGTKMYVVGEFLDNIYEYVLSTAFDITSTSYNNVNFGIGGQQGTSGQLVFNSDGTKMFLCGENEDYVRQYTLTSGFNLSTASLASGSFDHSSQSTTVTGMAFNGDGTKMFLASRASEHKVYQYSLSSAYDVSSASYDSVSLDISSQFAATLQGIVFNNDGSKMYGMDNGGTVFQYSTGGTVFSYATTATWANGTVNDELYTLQQALTAQAFNRMDKTQLDAIPDANHFPTGTSLDLMIALRMDAAASTLPTSDGVTLNYDAAALNEGAVLGTDYDFFHPAANKVQIKSLAAQNLKVRVV